MSYANGAAYQHASMTAPPDSAGYPQYPPGGSLPGPNKSIERALEENVTKYRKLKAKYLELQGHLVESQDHLKSVMLQNVRIKEENAGFKDRIHELETMLAQGRQDPDIPTNSAFPRGFVYPRPPPISLPDYAGLAQAMDEDDYDDARKNSAHVGEIVKRREAAEETQQKVEVERHRRATKRPRTTSSRNTPAASIPVVPLPPYIPPHPAPSQQQIQFAPPPPGSLPPPPQSIYLPPTPSGPYEHAHPHPHMPLASPSPIAGGPEDSYPHQGPSPHQSPQVFTSPVQPYGVDPGS